MTDKNSWQEQRDKRYIRLARRFAAAYASYVAGYSGVDYPLKQTEEVAPFWKDLAEFVSTAMAGRKEAELQFREMVTKYIQ